MFPALAAVAAASLAAGTSRLWVRPGGCDVRSRPDAVAERFRALIQESSRGNAALERLLPRSYGGLMGAVVLAGRERFIAWVTPDCKAFLVGALFREDGQNATAAAMQDADAVPAGAVLSRTAPANAVSANAVPASAGSAGAGSAGGQSDAPPPRGPASDLLQEASRARGILEGSRGPLVHVFFDFNCTFCSMLYLQMRPLLREGRLRVHWIPVAVLAESSRTQAASVLEARSPAAALADRQAGRSAGGGDAPGKPPRRTTIQALDANNDLLRKASEGLAATPLLLFRSRDGRTLHQAGALRQSSDLLALLPPGD